MSRHVSEEEILAALAALEAPEQFDAESLGAFVAERQRLLDALRTVARRPGSAEAPKTGELPDATFGKAAALRRAVASGQKAADGAKERLDQVKQELAATRSARRRLQGRVSGDPPTGQRINRKA